MSDGGVWLISVVHQRPLPTHCCRSRYPRTGVRYRIYLTGRYGQLLGRLRIHLRRVPSLKRR